MAAHSGAMSIGRGASTRRLGPSRRAANTPAASCHTDHFHIEHLLTRLVEGLEGNGPFVGLTSLAARGKRSSLNSTIEMSTAASGLLQQG